MRLQETPVLSVQHLTVRYGEGCPHCLAGGKLEKNRCPKCGTVCRVPRGKGKIVITCPKCGGEIRGKS